MLHLGVLAFSVALLLGCGGPYVDGSFSDSVTIRYETGQESLVEPKARTECAKQGRQLGPIRDEYWNSHNSSKATIWRYYDCI